MSEEKVARHIHLLGATGKLRTAEYEGKTHLVVPVIALASGVIHAVNSSVPEFVPASALRVAPQGWNGRPLVLGHPINSNGVQISANEPQVLESRGFGQIFGARCASGDRLALEAWADPDRLRKIPGGDRMLKRIEDEDIIEVSVGAFVVTEGKCGTYNGKDYKATWKDIIPDHLAFLEEGIGACSVAMGCGAHRAASAVHLVTASGFEILGGSGSGNFGHAGRKGQVGGSAGGSSGGGGGSHSSKSDDEADIDTRVEVAASSLGLTREDIDIEADTSDEELKRLAKSGVVDGDLGDLKEYRDLKREQAKKQSTSEPKPQFVNVDGVWEVNFEGEPAGTLQREGNKWVAVGKDGKRIPTSASKDKEEAASFLKGSTSSSKEPVFDMRGKKGTMPSGTSGSDLVSKAGKKTSSAIYSKDAGKKATDQVHASLTSQGFSADTSKDEGSFSGSSRKAYYENSKGEKAIITWQKSGNKEIVFVSKIPSKKKLRINEGQDMNDSTLKKRLLSLLGIKGEEGTEADEDDKTDAEALKALQEELRSLVGRRNNASDLARIQSMHDFAMELGAKCGEYKDDEESLRIAASYKDCEACDGSGSKDGNPCEICEGMGKLKSAEENTGGDSSAQGVDQMMTKELRTAAIKKLLDCPCSGYTAADVKMLEAASDERIEAFVKTAEEAKETKDQLKAAEAKAAAAEEANKTTEQKLGDVETRLKAAESKTLSEEEFMKVAPASMKALLEEKQSEDAARKESLIAELKTCQDAYSEDELKSMDIKALSKLAKIAKVEIEPDYSGRGTPRMAGKKEDDAFSNPPNPWEPGIKALQEKDGLKTH